MLAKRPFHRISRSRSNEPVHESLRPLAGDSYARLWKARRALTSVRSRLTARGDADRTMLRSPATPKTTDYGLAGDVFILSKTLAIWWLAPRASISIWWPSPRRSGRRGSESSPGPVARGGRAGSDPGRGCRSAGTGEAPRAPRRAAATSSRSGDSRSAGRPVRGMHGVERRQRGYAYWRTAESMRGRNESIAFAPWNAIAAR